MPCIAQESLIELTLSEQEVLFDGFEMRNQIGLDHDQVPESTCHALPDFLYYLRKEDHIELGNTGQFHNGF